MMTPEKQEKLKRFLSDPIAPDAVKEVLRESFLKQSKDVDSKDIRYLAAARIAITLLDNGWIELLKYKPDTPRSEDRGRNPGV